MASKINIRIESRTLGQSGLRPVHKPTFAVRAKKGKGSYNRKKVAA